MAKWLYIPVEVKVRELHAKLLLAKHAASQGYKVVIGRKAEMMEIVPRLPPGIFFAMWVQINFKNYFKTLKDKGFYITGLDEEGLVTFSDDMYAQFKLSPEALTYVDRFFAWGHYQANILKPFVGAGTAVDIVGNLRFDPLRKELRPMLDSEKEALQKKYGRYVLIVSSFGLSNHVLGAEGYMKALRKSQTVRTDEDEAFLRRYMVLQKKVFEDLLKTIPLLAKAYPDRTFIIRPHPGEDLALWRPCVQGLTNVVIENDGNVHSWILGADCIVHHFCTTALESYAADVPSIAYRPAKDEQLESMVPYVGSIEAMNGEDLVRKIGDMIAGNREEIERRRAKAQPFLKNYVQNLDGDYCYDSILKSLANSVEERQSDGLRLLKFRLLMNMLTFLRSLKSMLKPSKMSYVDHKFSSLTKEEIKAVLEAIPGSGQVGIKKLAPMCYVLEQHGRA